MGSAKRITLICYQSDRWRNYISQCRRQRGNAGGSINSFIFNGNTFPKPNHSLKLFQPRRTFKLIKITNIWRRTMTMSASSFTTDGTIHRLEQLGYSSKSATTHWNKFSDESWHKLLNFTHLLMVWKWKYKKDLKKKNRCLPEITHWSIMLATQPY